LYWAKTFTVDSLPAMAVIEISTFVFFTVIIDAQKQSRNGLRSCSLSNTFFQWLPRCHVFKAREN
jgi:hypothetical protein